MTRVILFNPATSLLAVEKKVALWSAYYPLPILLERALNFPLGETVLPILIIHVVLVGLGQFHSLSDPRGKSKHF